MCSLFTPCVTSNLWKISPEIVVLPLLRKGNFGPRVLFWVYNIQGLVDWDWTSQLSSSFTLNSCVCAYIDIGSLRDCLPASQIIPSFADLFLHLRERRSENECYVTVLSTKKTWSSGILGLTWYEILIITLIFYHVILVLQYVELAVIL